MAARMAANEGLARVALIDFMVLGTKALASGVLAALVLAFAALVLAGSAEAAATAAFDHLTENESTSNEPRSVAPTPASPDTAGVGALWASVSRDAESAELILGLFALCCTAGVVALGRAAP